MLRALAQSLAWLIFPPSCIHCNEPLADIHRVMCDACSHLLDLLDPSVRCLHCFGLAEEDECGECTDKPVPWHGAAAAFDYLGPAASLIKTLKYRNRPYLAKPAAAFLAAQFTRLNWPTPHMLVPVPMPWLRQMSRGYNQANLLATELTQFLQIPVVNALKRTVGTFSQAGLTHEQRQRLPAAHFDLCDISVYGRTVLLIDDVMTTGSTLHACAEALLKGEPSRIYVLTVCRTPR